MIMSSKKQIIAALIVLALAAYFLGSFLKSKNREGLDKKLTFDSYLVSLCENNKKCEDNPFKFLSRKPFDSFKNKKPLNLQFSPAQCLSVPATSAISIAGCLNGEFECNDTFSFAIGRAKGECVPDTGLHKTLYQKPDYILYRDPDSVTFFDYLLFETKSYFIAVYGSLDLMGCTYNDVARAKQIGSGKCYSRLLKKAEK
jgi:hypothetical protein